MESTPDARGVSQLARGLGWFSIGLGLAELAAPRAVSRLIGIEPSGRASGTLRALGARELASGLGILARPRDSRPLWSRVVGDAIDLGLLGWAFGAKRTSTQRLVAASVAMLGMTALDVLTSRKLQAAVAKPQLAQARATIRRSPSEVYAEWRQFERLPRFMQHLESVTDLGGGKSHWVVKLPTGNTVEWDAEIVADLPGERIAWRTLEGSDLTIRGTISFETAPGDRGTEVHIKMEVDAPGGAIGDAIAKRFAEADTKGDLRRFKQVLETGEVVKSDASIHATPHPARPSAKKELP